MATRYVRLALLVGLLLTPAWIAAANDALDTAYATILRGNFETGQAEVSRLLQNNASPDAVRVNDWLASHHDIVASRKELKAQTFEWNTEHARTALAEDNLSLALTFAAQAAPYAADPDRYAALPWVRELTQRCQEAARECERNERWVKALSHYALLHRIHPEDEEFELLHEQALRHARIQEFYKDEETMREHVEGVNRKLLQTTVRLIDRLYYEEPDFKKAGGGALDNLTTLGNTKKLYEFLDGLGNPALRQHFLRGLEERRAEIEAAEHYGYQDLIRLSKQLHDLNRGSIEIPEGLLVVEFLEGVYQELDDYTSVYWPSEAQAFEKSIMGGFEGVGIQLGVDERNRRLKVITPLENSPALEAGIQPDDIIIAVNGESTKGWTTLDAVDNISGPAGTEVILTMLRPRTGEEIAFKLVRRKIVQTSVRGVERVPSEANAWNYMLDEEAGIAYIRLTSFLPASHHELTRALEDAHAQGMKGLVLDVRYNPGGLLDVAVDVVSHFLERGEVVSTRGRLSSDTLRSVAGKALYEDVPLVILVNEGSASGSEILAGALQDHHRAIVLGERTFGKGSVQHIRTLGGSEAKLRLTTALYYLPSGRSPHKQPDAETWGIEPDWEVKLTPKEIRRVLEQQRETFIIHNEDADGENKALSEGELEKLLAAHQDDEDEEDDEPPFLTDEDIKLLDSDPYEAPGTDPQLETALLMIRVKLAANVPWPRELAAADRSEKP
ncbi:MAG: S41 family peptidase [Phycisphaerae bacterium]|nr:S41 family peptidase [Phycisphaerae bacterium]